VPVIGYVSPSGARAASAGTFILYATHIAVMAPGTNIGAATPINLGGEETPAPEAGKEKSAPAPAGAGERKAINDAAAFIRSLAEMRGRNAHWGERAVRGGEAISAREALRLGVIDFIAADRDDLLRMLDGRAVTAGGAARTLHTRGASVDVVQPSTIARLLGVLVNPNVAFLLMLIGFYGLVFEFANPGLVAPGVIGAMCLVLGLYALNQLPLNYAGLALVLLGLGFVIAEAFTPTFGVLGIAGAPGLLLGAAMLIDTDIPQYRLSWGVILGAAAMSGAFAALVVGSAVRAHRRRVATGPDAMIGRSVEVLDWAGGAGHVMAQGERWRAIGPDALSPGRKARVVKVDGLTVHVTNNGNQGESP
ncbi:MAG: nodulation protein NfeD, partial [Hyphomonadaceae bacterium]